MQPVENEDRRAEHRPHENRPARRRFLERASALVSGLALSLVGCSPEGSPTSAVSGARPSQQGSPGRHLLPDMPGVSLGVLTATTLPRGFSWLGALRQPQDGFLNLDQHSSMAFVSNEVDHGYRFPLVVYLGEGEGGVLACTKGIPPRSVEQAAIDRLGTASGYHLDGMWMMSLEPEQGPRGTPIVVRDRVHAIVLSGGGYSIGVRGSVQHGCDVRELRELVAGLRFA